MIWRAIVAVTQVGLLATAAWAAWAGPLATPVFSTAARVAAAAPADDWRAGALRALYEVKPPLSRDVLNRTVRIPGSSGQ